MRAALFDMDRTLVRESTATLYHQFQRDIGEATAVDSLQVGYWMFQYTLGIIDAERVARRVIASLAGKQELWLRERCTEWFKDYVLKHIGDDARRTVAVHKQRGDVVAMVTAATVYAAEPVAKEFGIDHVVASELEVHDGVFSGKFVPPLAYGVGKITRLSQLLSALAIPLRDCTFYSDSVTDLPLLEAVATPVAVNPDRRLASLAKRRHWRIETWR